MLGLFPTSNVAVASGGFGPTSESIFLNNPSSSFVVPANVHLISIVCVGGGAKGAGGGGALAYANAVPVTPGETLIVIVGSDPGLLVPSLVQRFSGSIICSAENGGGGADPFGGIGGQVLVGTGGNGGDGGDPASTGGGGGAGGYSGNGGIGGATTLAGSDGTGGAGGGGGGELLAVAAGGGGGVGLYGEGASGLGGGATFGGKGGSGGGDGSRSNGGVYGGGGGGNSGTGQQGAVRIIWGRHRLFPNTRTGEIVE